jgi:RND family efflux transporter MFP subunit
MEGAAVHAGVPRGLKPALYGVAGLKPALSLAVVLAAMLASGCTSQRSEPAPQASAPITVSTARVASVDLPSRIEAGGLVQAGSTANVTSRVVAPIQQVHVRAGDRVTRGQRLVTLDARELTANTERSTSAMTAATESARAAESRTAAAEAALRLATATHSRISALAEKRSATPQELDQADAALRAAEAQLQTARSESAAAAASREAARAATDATTVAGSYAVLTAPFDGIVADRLADPGSLATPGSPIVVLEESGPIRFEVRLDQSRASGIVAGQEAQVRLDGDATWLAAKVVEVGRTDVTSHSFLVKLELPSNTRARTGSFGLARFAGAPRRTLVVPSASLIRRAGLVFVFTVDTDRRARLRPVVAGTVDGARTEVLAGVADGDTVVVSPPATITDGSVVDAVRESGLAGGRS